MDEHVCDGLTLDGVDVCIEGVIYGVCENEVCNGGCEDAGGCNCDCHSATVR